MSELVFLKLGGSLITDKRRQATVRDEVIRRVAREVKASLNMDRGLRLLIGHGSGSFGHFAAQRLDFAYRKQSGFQGFFEIGAAAARLNRIVTDRFLAEGVPVFPIQPSASALAREGSLVGMEDSVLKKILSQNGVPVVYGDVCLDDVWGWTIVSTEAIFSHLSPVLTPARILLAGDTSGVHSGNPSADPNTNLLPKITPGSFEAVRASLTGADGYDVTGGMLTKVESMLVLVQDHPGLEVHVFSGLEPGGIESALRGEINISGTIIRAD